MWPGTSFCSCPPARGAAGAQGGDVCQEKWEEESALDFSWHRLSLVRKHSPSCNCDKSRLAATTLMHSMACSHHSPDGSTCLQLTCFPHLTPAKGASIRFLEQSQPSGIPPAKLDAVGMQAPQEQQLLLSLWLGCRNYPRRSNNNPDEVHHTASTQHLPLTKACFSQHTAPLAQQPVGSWK